MGQQPGHRTKTAAALVCALVLVAAACGGGDSDESTASTVHRTLPPPAEEPTTSSAATQASARPCDDDNLKFGAGATYPDPTIRDRICATSTALATVSSSGIPGGVGVGFFQVGDEGIWLLVKVSAIDGDVTAELPEGFAASLATSWRSLYDARIKKESGGGEIDPNEVGGINDESGTTTTTEPVNLCVLLPPDLPPDQIPVECGGIPPAPGP